MEQSMTGNTSPSNVRPKLLHKPYTELKKALRQRGVTYRDVAQLLSISPDTVRHKINGSSDFYPSEHLKICEAYGISPYIFSELCCDYDNTI